MEAKMMNLEQLNCDGKDGHYGHGNYNLSDLV